MSSSKKRIRVNLHLQHSGGDDCCSLKQDAIQQEYSDIKRRFWIAFFFTVPLIFLATFEMFHQTHLSYQGMQWALATPLRKKIQIYVNFPGRNF